jgi:hypothetical protein
MNNPILFIKDAGHGETPPCPDAIFKRGDVVKVRSCKRLSHVPSEAVVHDIGTCRPCGSYWVSGRGEAQKHLVREKDLTPTGKTVEIGSITREGARA